MKQFNLQQATDFKGRIEWIDTAKGIGILLVVLAHCWRGLIDNGVMQWTDGLRLLDHAIYSFHMPLFFFLSGFTAGGTVARRRQKYIFAKIKSVAYPYFLWSAMIGLILMRAGGAANTRFTWSDMLALPWLPIQQFWFLQALFFAQMLKAVAGGDRVTLLAAGALFIVAALLPNSEATVAVVFHFSLFFALGLIAKHFVARLATYPFLFVALAFGVSVAAALATGRHYTDVVFLPAALTGIAVTIRSAIGLSHAARGMLFSALGRMSMSIYVAHIVAASGSRILLTKIGFAGGPIGYFILCVAAGLIAPITMHLCLERLNLLWVFGLGKRRRSMHTAHIALAS